MGACADARAAVAFDQAPRQSCFNHRRYRRQATLGGLPPQPGGHCPQRGRQPAAARPSQASRYFVDQPGWLASVVEFWPLLNRVTDQWRYTIGWEAFHSIYTPDLKKTPLGHGEYFQTTV